MVCREVVKVVSFDVTNTLIRLKTSPGSIYSCEGAKYGINLNKEAIDSVFRTNFKSLMNERPCFGFGQVDGVKKWWRELMFKSCGLDTNENSNKFVNDLFVKFGEGHFYELINQNSAHILENLHLNGFKLAVVSNSDFRIRYILQHLGIAQYFSRFIISSETGIAKPDVAVFKRLSESFGCQNKNILHIGDSKLLDYDPIIKCGGQGLILADKEDDCLVINNLNKLNQLLIN
uniref:Haloacid dehalogenase-like hydrolase domain-containing protein 3 n=1 Tax=Rhabditophanes sp. KR3021 TaxID=114890 RepID=A0AC35TIC1_9BILA